MRIKICGITGLSDALAAAELGADLLGFNFYPKSPRHIDRLACEAICSELENRFPLITRVGVFVNQPPEEVLETLDRCGLHLAQLSGDEPVSDLAALRGRAFKAVRFSAGSEAGLAAYLETCRGETPAGLVDASVPGQFGGTGQVADWSKAADLARRVPILLAGGLTPENVAGAVREVQPWGVDVASGVEAAPGKKDPLKVSQFIRNARLAAQSTVLLANEVN
ncbi:MAG TPA: phosphoribosylanthranilate isomerase [Anaerolineales bacterium]|nr:phosphoribosylanthranilate isomerase [Anaerolineales bacterium]